jgi:hypothetical protein
MKNRQGSVRRLNILVYCAVCIHNKLRVYYVHKDSQGNMCKQGSLEASFWRYGPQDHIA